MLTGALGELIKDTKKKNLNRKYYFLDFRGVDCTNFNTILLFLLP
jgi:hypothetical protein